MNTPIYDFVQKYAESSHVRMHMPGHKGSGNAEKYDITEISGADSLYEASGIIKESEEKASRLFGADTFYSAEGSSLSIRAMIMLIDIYAKSQDKDTLILASRNAHKVFVSAVAIIGCDTRWICGSTDSYLSSCITAEDVENAILTSQKTPTAVYLTSPDYLGNMLDIKAISEVCKRHGVLLAVDNAHGAYLRFLESSLHPIDLGADIACDSAHKTLPCLTGAAYLHVSKDAPRILKENAKNAMALFGSTSPSYLILASLDKANKYLEADFRDELSALIKKLDLLKEALLKLGYSLYGNEPMKLTVKTKPYGYYGFDLAKELEKKGIIPEFADRDFLTLMPSTKTTDADLQALTEAFSKIEKREAIAEAAPEVVIPERKMPPREAVLSLSEWISVDSAIGRVLADITVGCPPAVPIIVSGEIIDENAVKAFKYYGIEKIKVVK
ncbi:MAG: aminotransferase class V-fold PLP-dependent enzyme [Ruminococcaceae bacterium]|nr:aminotransferase class V-fold PLP-dependent enzyme [Oscillospiraceae bacterium]